MFAVRDSDATRSPAPAARHQGALRPSPATVITAVTEVIGRNGAFSGTVPAGGAAGGGAGALGPGPGVCVGECIGWFGVGIYSLGVEIEGKNTFVY